MNTILHGSLYVLVVLALLLIVILPLLVLLLKMRSQSKKVKKLKHRKVAGRKVFGANKIEGSGNTQGYGNIVHNYHREGGMSDRERSFVETINLLIKKNYKAEDRHESQIKYMYAQLQKTSEENDALWDENTKLKYELQQSRIPFIEMTLKSTDTLNNNQNRQ